MLETSAGSMYLTKRPNTQNWQLEIRFPRDFSFDHLSYFTFKGRKHFTMSLGTADKAVAEIKAAPLIHAYRVAIYMWRHRQPSDSRNCDKAFAEKNFEQINSWLAESKSKTDVEPLSFQSAREHQDGLRMLDGFQAFVDGDKITTFDSNGDVMKILKNEEKLRTFAPFVDDDATAAAMLYFDARTSMNDKYVAPSVNMDISIIEDYIKERALSPRIAADARATWAFYMSKIGKPLKNASRKDGKEFVRLLFAENLAHATVKKKVGWLAAACAYAIDEGKNFKTNPFYRVMPIKKDGDALERLPLSEEHMRLCFKNLHRLSDDDALLWKLLAKTGMRLGEAMSIRKEELEVGSRIRFVTVGTKTDSSRRRVALPLDIGLPEKIDRQLFAGTPAAASKRLNRHIKASILDWTPELVVHSLRHRVVDVCRWSLKVDPYLARRLVGHAYIDVHDRYGKKGPPLSLVKPIIDKIAIDGSQQLWKEPSFVD